MNIKKEPSGSKSSRYVFLNLEKKKTLKNLTNKRAGERTDGRMNALTDGPTKERTSEQANERTDGRTNEQTNERASKQIHSKFGLATARCSLVLVKNH